MKNNISFFGYCDIIFIKFIIQGDKVFNKLSGAFKLI